MFLGAIRLTAERILFQRACCLLPLIRMKETLLIAEPCACLQEVCVADAVGEERVGIRNGIMHEVTHSWHILEACVKNCNGTHSRHTLKACL